jgi:hypothetical protein
MSLSRLAAVELQLVMQCCDLQSLLALSRCSRHSLAAASSDFAWRCLSPLCLFPTQLQRDDPAARSRSLPLRFCDSHFEWRPLHPDVQSELGRIHSLPRLRSLNSLKHAGLSPAVWQRLLAHPALSGLTSLRIGVGMMREDDGSLLPLLAAHCPRLSRLHVYNECLVAQMSQSALDGLWSLPALSDLLLSGDLAAIHARAVSRCSSLRRLQLRSIDYGLRPVLDALQLPQLESLTLDSVRLDASRVVGGGRPIASDLLDWTVCFAHMHSLTSLSLERCSGVDRVLTALQSHCPASLQSLRIRPPSNYGSALPDLQLLGRLLDQRPPLRLHLAWSALHDVWTAALQQPHSTRVTIGEFVPNPLLLSRPFGAWRD